MTHDDLTPWQDTAFLQALTSEGTDSELAGENAALAAFHKSASHSRHGVVRLLGTGVTSVALVGLVGGGVAAAAYTRSLPKPVQDVMHDVLGPIGVPAPHNPTSSGHRRTAAVGTKQPFTSTAHGTSATTPTASPDVASPSPSAHPSLPAANPVVSPPVGSPTPTLTPSASLSPQASTTPTPTATPSATPTGPAGDPSTWSMTATASSQAVKVHDSVRISGTLLDASGQPVADRRVVIRVHQAGTDGWERAAARRTDANGSVQARLDDLTQNTVVVLGAGHGVHSSPLRIVVEPTLSTTVTPGADGSSYVITVTADGGRPGDVVNLVRHTSSGWEQVGQAQLDSSGSASFSVPAPKRQRGYVVRLPATNMHGAAATRIVLQPLS